MNNPKTKTSTKKVVRDLETTYDLLQATLPFIKSPESKSEKVTITPAHTPADQKYPSPYVASSEDEVFFGPITDKETNGKNAR